MQTAVTSPFSRASTTAEVLEGIDLSGRHALVTGANSGIGRETARALLSAGAEVVLAVRNLASGEEVAAQLREETGRNGVGLTELDLMSAASIDACAERYARSGKPLHLLINNAGVMACPLSRNGDGIESQLQSNALGPLQLSLALADVLAASAPARVVMVSSSAHRFSPVVFEDINYQQRDYVPMQAYGQSKTALNLLTIALQRQLGERGINCYAVHPGVIQTNLMRHMTAEELQGVSALLSSRPDLLKSVESGAATTVWAATAPELEQRGGSYLEDCQVARMHDDPSDLDGVMGYAVDPDSARRLWLQVLAMPPFKRFAAADMSR